MFIARYNTIADRNWARLRFVARPLSQRWVGRLQPRLSINPSRLLLGSGNTIYSYGFGTASEHASPPVTFDGAYTTSALHPENDISALIYAIRLVRHNFSLQQSFIKFILRNRPRHGGMKRTTLSHFCPASTRHMDRTTILGISMNGK